jgi:hypothetical protein
MAISSLSLVLVAGSAAAQMNMTEGSTSAGTNLVEVFWSLAHIQGIAVSILLMSLGYRLFRNQEGRLAKSGLLVTIGSVSFLSLFVIMEAMRGFNTMLLSFAGQWSGVIQSLLLATTVVTFGASYYLIK